LELDQILFKKILGLYGKWKPTNDKEEAARTVRLDAISPRLTLLARALTGRNVDVLPAEKEGGWKDDVFFLPTSFSELPSLEQNQFFYLYRVVFLSIQSRERLNWHTKAEAQSLEFGRQKALAAAPIVLEFMQAEFPSVAQFFYEVKPHFEKQNGDPKNRPEPFWLYGKYMVNEGVAASPATNSPSTDDGTNPHSPTTEIASKPVEEAEVIAVDKKAQDDYMLTHNFEKVETADEFSGVWRGFDGDDELAEHAEALNELNLKHLVRTDEQAHSVYRAEFRGSVNIAESEETDIGTTYVSYPEWDFGKKQYKPGYCKVFLNKIKGGDLAYAQKCLSENQKTLNQLRRKFAQIHQQRRMVRHMADGENIDMDALVDWFADLRSGHTPSENIYTSTRKNDPDLALFFLLDLSLSTDSYADGNRVLDVEKQAVILFGEALNEYRVDFAVAGFCSQTRNHCTFHTLKGFGEDWTKGKQRLGSAEPQGYTRIGPALRHSKALIEAHPAARKWVVLLSDGKPNDYDRYEGQYGIADVRQALRELHERHISTYAVAVESVARYYLPQMFGQNHYNILSHPDQLVQALAMLYRRINEQ
jgi:nitric oxide reductase NorD protein